MVTEQPNMIKIIARFMQAPDKIRTFSERLSHKGTY
jgi:hypothetical protein